MKEGKKYVIESPSNKLRYQSVLCKIGFEWKVWWRGGKQINTNHFPNTNKTTQNISNSHVNNKN